MTFQSAHSVPKPLFVHSNPNCSVAQHPQKVEGAASKPPLAPEEAAAEESRSPEKTPSVSNRGARGSPPTDHLTTRLDFLLEQQGAWGSTDHLTTHFDLLREQQGGSGVSPD